jgi:hypothetical protein
VWVWALFGSLVLATLALDLGVFRSARVVSLLASSPLLLRHPLEELAGLHVKCGAQPVERVGCEAAELYAGVGQPVRGRHCKPRLPGEPVWGPTLPFENRSKMKADQGAISVQGGE